MARRTVIEELVVLVTGDMTRYQRMMDQFNRYNRIITAQTGRLFHRFGRRVFQPMIDGLRRTTLAIRSMMNTLQTGVSSVMNRIGRAFRRNPLTRGLFNFRLGFGRGLSGLATAFTTRAARFGQRVGRFVRPAYVGARRFGAAARAGYTGIPLMNRFGRPINPDFLQRMGIRTGAAGALAMRGMGAGFAGARGMLTAGRNLAAGFSRGLSGRLLTGAVARLRNFSTLAGKTGFLGGTGVRLAGQGAMFVGRQARLAGGGFMGGLRREQVSRATNAGRAGQMAGRMTRVGGGGLLGGGAIAGLATARMAGTMGAGFGRMGGIVGGFGRNVVRTFGTAFARATGHVGKFFSTFSRFANSMAYRVDMIGRRLMWFVTVPLALVAVSSVTAFAKFDDAIQKSVALLGGVSDVTRDAMIDTVAAISSNSITAPTELAEGYITLASAGYSAAESMKVLGTVEKFAVAGMMDMKDSASSLIGVQSALGKRTGDLVTDNMEMTHIADVMTRANQISQGTIEDFADALTNKGAAALRLLNKPMEEGVAILAAYASQNVKGTAAGEKLYIVLRDLQRAAIKQPAAWKQLGIDVFDASGNMNDMADIIGQMEGAFGGMSDQQKRATFMMLGLQDRSISSTMQLMGMSDAIRGFRGQLDRANGAMQQVVDIRLKSFSAQMIMLRNKINLVSIGIGKLLVPVLMWMNEQVEKAIKLWNGLSEPVRRFAVIMGLALTALGPFMLTMGLALMTFTSFAGALGVVKTLAMAVIGPIATVVGLIMSLAATALTSGIGLLITLITTMLGSVGAVISAFITMAPLILAILGPIGLIFSIITGGIGVVLALVAGFGAVSAVFWKMLGDVKYVVKSTVSNVKGAISSVFTYVMSLFAGITEGGVITFDSLWKRIKEGFMTVVGFFHNFTANMEILFNWIRDNWVLIANDIANASKTAFENMQYNARVAFELVGSLFKEMGDWLIGQMKYIFVTAFQRYVLTGIDGALNTLMEFARLTPTFIKFGVDVLMEGTNASIPPEIMAWAEKITALGADAGAAAGDSLLDRFGNVLNKGPKFKGVLQGFDKQTASLPAFITDLPKAADAARAPVDAVGKSLAEIKDIAEEDINIHFGVEGIDAVRASSAEWARIVMNSMSQVSGASGGITNATSPQKAPGSWAVNKRQQEMQRRQKSSPISGMNQSLFGIANSRGFGVGQSSAIANKAFPAVSTNAGAVTRGQGSGSWAVMKRQQEMARRASVNRKTGGGGNILDTMGGVESDAFKDALGGGAVPPELAGVDETNSILERILETMEMNNELMEQKGSITIEPANLA